MIEDLNSRHGTWVNGKQVARHVLQNSDRIEFGVRDSYQLTFSVEKQDIQRLLEQFGSTARPAGEEDGADNLVKLRSLVEVARALQNSLSTDEVLTAVVDAALAVTGCERGFLLLRPEGARTPTWMSPLPATTLAANSNRMTLRVPRHLIRRSPGLAPRSALDVVRSLRRARRASRNDRGATGSAQRGVPSSYPLAQRRSRRHPRYHRHGRHRRA